MQVAEAASNYRQLRRRADIFPYWVYRTAGDGQMRPSHAALDGLTLPASDPAWRKIFPPNDWNCRCRVEAIMADEFEEDFGEEQKKMQAFLEEPRMEADDGPGLGREPRPRRPRSSRRIKCTSANSPTGRLRSSANSIASITGCRRSGSGWRPRRAESVPFSGDPAGWFAQNGRFTDFSGKTIELPERTFATHTSGKYTAARVPLLDDRRGSAAARRGMAEQLRRQGVRLSELHPLYRDKAINVVCRIENGKTLAVRTWFEIAIRPTTRSGGKKIAPEKDPRLKYRRGLLVKK